ncbi:MAG TPA: helix-turn-helix domain-containing protein, partial [Pirellulales bacterium]|nr:helix-turn-helix domain-containing protein [Pirellulales bacterium]
KENYTESQAAAWLALSRSQLRDARLRGEVQAYKVTKGRVRYRKCDLLEYLLKNPAGSGKPRVRPAARSEK